MAGIAAAELWEAIQEGKLTGDPAFEELLRQDRDAVQAFDACVYSSSAATIF